MERPDHGGSGSGRKQPASGKEAGDDEYGGYDRLDEEVEFRLPRGHRPVENLDTDGLEQASVDTRLASSNVGFRLLQKMGWKSGKGLGKNEQGSRWRMTRRCRTRMSIAPPPPPLLLGHGWEKAPISRSSRAGLQVNEHLLCFVFEFQVVSFYGLTTPPYKTDALEPYMSRRAVELHWGKRQQDHMDGLNKQLAISPLYGHTLEDLIKEAYNNGNPLPEHNDAAEDRDLVVEPMSTTGSTQPSRPDIRSSPPASSESVRAHNSGSSSRSAAPPPAAPQAGAANPLRFDARTIHFSVNAWEHVPSLWSLLTGACAQFVIVIDRSSILKKIEDNCVVVKYCI